MLFYTLHQQFSLGWQINLGDKKLKEKTNKIIGHKGYMLINFSVLQSDSISVILNLE